MTDGPNENPGCLGAILRMFGINGGEASQAAEQLPYRLRDDFLSPAEKSFYYALTSAVGTQATVCPKVNLSDIFFVTRPNENQSARGRISQKHLDFLLCEPSSMRPFLGVELDDSSHARRDRQARDDLVNDVFKAANLPLVHVAVRNGYDLSELLSVLAPYLQSGPPQVPPAPIASVLQTSTAPPVCRKCGVPMVVRTSGRGETKGSQFYGCVNYPKCRETVPLD